MFSMRSVRARSPRARATLCALVVGTVACADMPAEEAPLMEEVPSADQPWFGVMLPPGLAPHTLQVISDRPAAPAVVPRGESQYRELAGSAIQADLETIVGFSRESEETAEVGAGQMWGRITGFESGSKTVEWAVNQFRAAGISDVELQPFNQAEGASIWLPLSWEVRLLGDPAFGAVAVFTIIDLPGNMHARDIGCGGGTCFNIGGRDGRFLESVMDAAAAAGTLDDLRVQMRLESQRFSGLSAANGVAIIPGTSRSDEYVVLNAHVDAWFDGA